MTRLAHRHALLARDARFMIERVVRFQQAVAREVMVPRPRVVTIDRSWDLDTVRQFIRESGHSRFPVVDGSPDDIAGVLLAKHLLQLEAHQRWSDLVVPALFVPEAKLLPDLLHDFRTAGQHLDLVLDEYGGLSGVVTLEDALELLVGEIEDEFDQDESSAIISADGVWSVPGHLSLRRLEVLLHRIVDSPTDVDSVGGLVSHVLGEKIKTGASTRWDDLRIQVEEVEDGRATRVLVRPLPPGGEASS
jgi:magnesium and cobalt transporter